jgi:hypothetical protein
MIDTSCERAREVGVPAPAMKRRRPMVAKVRKIDGNPGFSQSRRMEMLLAGAHGSRSYLARLRPCSSRQAFGS